GPRGTSVTAPATGTTGVRYPSTPGTHRPGVARKQTGEAPVRRTYEPTPDIGTSRTPSGRTLSWTRNVPTVSTTVNRYEPPAADRGGRGPGWTRWGGPRPGPPTQSPSPAGCRAGCRTTAPALAVAELLGENEADLWPQARPDLAPGAESTAEVVGAYAHRA